MRKSRVGRTPLATPKMTIKTHMPWQAKGLLWLLAAVVVAAIVVGAFGLQGKLPALPVLSGGGEQQASLREQVEKLTSERDQLAAAANAAEARLNIERAAQNQLATQVKNLERDNIRLKEDLVFYDSLLPTATGPAGISIRRLKAENIAPNQVRYQALVMQGGKGAQEFLGSMQVVLNVIADGKPAMMVFPDAKLAADQSNFKLRFKHYQRLDGILTVPNGTIVKSVQARVLENGQTRAQQAVNL